MKYLDFDCSIEFANGVYKVNVHNSPAGKARTEAHLPFSELELENYILRLTNFNITRRRLTSKALVTAKEFGGRLFNAFFTGAVRDCWNASLIESENQQAGLRLLLCLDDQSKLLALPWEYLLNPIRDTFFCLSMNTPLVRYLNLPQPNRPLKVTPPLNVLVMSSSPVYSSALEVEQEWNSLKNALSALESKGLVAIDRLETATLEALQRKLYERDYHIFHFIGHGSFDEIEQEGMLHLEGKNGLPDTISAQKLATLLQDERPLRLVILNACEGARTSNAQPYGGAAQTLIQKGIPAVIAMQFEITDKAALCFAKTFYEMLACGQPVEMAMAETRKALFTAGHEMEWATPVLYMHTRDSKIFDIEKQTPSNLKPKTTIAPETESKPKPTKPQDRYEQLHAMQALLGVLHHLNDLPPETQGVSIRESVDRLGIERGVLVATLNEQVKAGLIVKNQNEGRTLWKLSETGREMVSRLQKSIAPCVRLPESKERGI